MRLEIIIHSYIYISRRWLSPSYIFFAYISRAHTHTRKHLKTYIIAGRNNKACEQVRELSEKLLIERVFIYAYIYMYACNNNKKNLFFLQ